ncbi:MAG: hypothetical protein KGP14_00350 [Betaproteobacteria bacterium]|nr:hypothetical protein [Betaproteobacteria bacterium]
MKRGGILTAASLALLLVGCAGGSNVKGSWNCGTAVGTCAPTISIDDGAIKQIIGSQGQSADLGAGGAGQAVGTYGSDTGGRRAKMEFPAYTDERGRYHEPQIVYMNVSDDVTVTDGSAPRVSDYQAGPAGAVTRQNLVTTASDAVPAQVDPASLVPTDQPVAAAPVQEAPKRGLLQRVFGPKPKVAVPAPAPVATEAAPVNAPDRLVPPSGE